MIRYWSKISNTCVHYRFIYFTKKGSVEWGTSLSGINIRVNFFSDGTYDSTGVFSDGTYKIKDEKLVLTWQYDTGGTNTDVYSYSFSDNDTTLTLGGGWIFTKQ